MEPPARPGGANEHDCVALAAHLNADCQCTSLDRARLSAELDRVSPGFTEQVMAGRPHLFSDLMVFVSAMHARRMAALIEAVERVVAMPAYAEHVLQWAPALARSPQAARGVFFGYDFHLGERGPELIEINTNAGGGLLNAVLDRAQRACCDRVQTMLLGELDRQPPDQLFLRMFREEWRRASGDRPLSRIAIVDDSPTDQYLYPEFVLLQRLFVEAHLEAVICDPRELSLREGALWHGEHRVDMVYNRLTDFALADPAHAVLREAYEVGAAVITPHPRAHALFADKRNLVTLCDDGLLASWGVDAESRATLAACIPPTERVAAAHAEDLWARRKTLFFKPAAGYGSKAAYRGDKITKRVFEEVLASEYVAQALVPPSSRRLEVDGVASELKLDLRNYVYAGQVQLVVARLWQGQTTNFRTPGGGFAPVLAVPCDEVPLEHRGG